MTNTTPGTIGAELPTYLQYLATPAVLKLTIEEAYTIVVEDGEWPDEFTQKDADSLDKIYQEYEAVHQAGSSTSAFWNQPPATNQAIWAQKTS